MTAPKELRVGLIGPGQIADERLIPALKKIPGAVLWSVLGRNLEKTKAFAAKHGAKAPVATYDNIDAFVADKDLDAVIIASPDGSHSLHAVKCASLGKHIFLEKPMATSSEEAQLILEAASANKVKVAVGYHLRFHAGHQKVEQLARSGKLGKLQHMRVSWTMKANPSDWRASSAQGKWWSLAATGTHCLDFVRWIMGPECGEIVDVRSVVSNSVYGGPHEETAVVAIKFENGATAEVMCSVVFRAPRVVEIYGTEGSVICTETLGPRGTGTIKMGDEPVEFVPCDPYVGELTNFIDAIRNDTKPLVDGEEGLANVGLLEASARLLTARA